MSEAVRTVDFLELVGVAQYAECYARGGRVGLVELPGGTVEFGYVPDVRGGAEVFVEFAPGVSARERVRFMSTLRGFLRELPYTRIVAYAPWAYREYMARLGFALEAFRLRNWPEPGPWASFVWKGRGL